MAAAQAPSYTTIPGMDSLGYGFNAVTNEVVGGACIYQYTYPDPTKVRYNVGGKNGGGYTWTPDGTTPGGNKIPPPILYFSLPCDVSAAFDVSFSSTEGIVAQSAAEVATAMSGDFNISGSYGEFSGSAEVQFAQKEETSDSNYYAQSSGSGVFFALSLSEQLLPGGGQKANLPRTTQWNPDFASQVAGLPNSFDPSNPDPAFNQFFETWGTHIVQSVNLGYNCRLTVAVDRSKYVDTESAKAMVQLQVDCIVKADTNDQLSYSNDTSGYSSSISANCQTYGGDSTLGNEVQAQAEGNPTSPWSANGAFVSWLKSCYYQPCAMGYSLVPIWIAAGAAGASQDQQFALQYAYYFNMLPQGAVPVWEYSFAYPGNPTAYFYTTFDCLPANMIEITRPGSSPPTTVEVTEGLAEPLPPGWSQNGIAFWVLPPTSGYANANPPSGYVSPSPAYPNPPNPIWPLFPVSPLYRYNQDEGNALGWFWSLVSGEYYQGDFPEANLNGTMYVIGTNSGAYQSRGTPPPPAAQVLTPVYRWGLINGFNGVTTNCDTFGFSTSPSSGPPGAFYNYNPDVPAPNVPSVQFYAFSLGSNGPQAWPNTPSQVES